MSNQAELPRGVWSFDPDKPLGSPGGFGQVFEGTGPNNEIVAVKRVNLEVGEMAKREVVIAAELIDRDLAHVMPILDAGQDAESDHFFIIMPRAERSLQDDLRAGKTWTDGEAAQVMLEIAQGLLEVEEVIHRDLKPPNVLWYEGAWRIADFGIARLSDAPTSPRTLKGCYSLPYASPEQWRHERATTASDVYAL